MYLSINMNFKWFDFEFHLRTMHNMKTLFEIWTRMNGKNFIDAQPHEGFPKRKHLFTAFWHELTLFE